MGSSSNDKTGDDLKSVDPKENPYSRGSASVSASDTDAEPVSDAVSHASSSVSDTLPQDINYDNLLNLILDITDDNDLERQIEKFVVNIISNIQSRADTILLKSMMIYFIVVIDYRLHKMQDDNKKAKNKIKIFKEVLSKNNFHKLPIENVIDETEIGDALKSMQDNNPLFRRFINENKQHILAMCDLMPYSYFNMFIDLYKFEKLVDGHGSSIGMYGHIIESYTPILKPPHHTLPQLPWYKDKIIKSIVTVENFLSSIWRNLYTFETFKYEHKDPKHQNDIKDATNIIEQLKKHVDEQKDDTPSSAAHKEMLKKMLDYIKTQLFGEIYGYWQDKKINRELFYDAADESIRELYNLQQPLVELAVANFTSLAATAEKKLSPRNKQIENILQQRTPPTTSLGPSLSPRTISAHAAPPPHPPLPVRHLPLPFIPQPPQKVDYHNLKYAKFKPLPEFTKYYPTYVGLAALKAVPLLKQVFNADEQTIWKYMQKRSILFNKTNNKTNNEKEFASKLIFAVLAEQITKNIRNDFDIKDINFRNFQNFIEIELLKMLTNNDIESVKHMTKLVYKNIYNNIVIKLFE